MKEFKRRLNAIYPPYIYIWVIFTIFCGFFEFLVYDPDNIFNISAILIAIVWLYYIYYGVRVYIIRIKVLKFKLEGRGPLLEYLESRVPKEKRMLKRLLIAFIEDIKQKDIKI